MPADKRDALTQQFDKASRIAAAEPVAVVGIGCRFPGGAVGPEGYWNLLANGGDGISEIPSDRWNADEYYDPDQFAPGRMSSKWGGFLPDVAGFDADYFGISPREAEAMDPQQRLMLEVAYEALEHAGIATEGLAGIRAAVMMGVYYTEYQTISAANPDTIDAYSATGNAHAVAVGRIAYLLGLRGPAVAIDSACSSSLVTIHLACQSLRLRESDLALAGGVSLILRPETQIAMSKWGMLSPNGRCYSFDAHADGFVRGEGAGVVVLKRLIDAVRDGDRVLAVVRGSAINQDGRSNGLTAPNTIAQCDVITRAVRSADVTAGSVNFIEAHGTGTSLGDPIEFEALAEVYGRGDGPCALGAVKTNIGHLEAAAGIAGFIKAALSVQRGQIPPNLHFSQWNPAIDPSPTRLFVPTELSPWPVEEGPRRAAVSSFGLGGTNAHVVIEQGPDPVPVSAADSGAPVTTLTVSGKTEQRIASWATALADWVTGEGAAVPLADVAHTVNLYRSRHNKLATVSARDRAELVSGLRALAAGQPTPGVVGPREAPHGSGTVFLYSGQGSQWAGMGRQLLADEPAFAAAVAELEPDFVAQVGFSLRDVLLAGEPVVGIERIQPVLVGMQLALTALWRSYGVEPDAVIGHSMGEVTAAVVAGALSPADGLKVIATRSKLMSRLSGQGAMALLELGATKAEKLVKEYPDITVAVYAAPQQTVIAGPPEQVDAVIAVVDAQGRLARRIEVDVASHHPTVDPILPELRSALADLAPVAPRIPLISTVGQANGGEPVFDADYWVVNLRNPVRFSQAVAAAAEHHATFIEVSPHPLLSHAITGTLESAGPRGGAQVAATLNRDNPETLTFHTQLATVRPPSAAATQTADGTKQLIDLPPTPWQHVRYWAAPFSATRQSASAHPLLGTHVELPNGRDHVFTADVGLELVAYLADHKVHGQPVMPGTGFGEIALAAACEALGLPAQSVAVGVEVEQMLPLGDSTQLTTQLSRGEKDSDEIRIEIHSRSATGAWIRHAVAKVEVGQSQVPSTPTASSDPGTVVSPADLYSALRATGLHHGQAFAALTRIVRRPNGTSETEVVLPDEATGHRGYRIHPVLLDAALQGLAAALSSESLADSNEATYLPVSFERIRVFGEVGRRARCHAELVNPDGRDSRASGIMGRVLITDDTGTPTAEISGIYLQRVQRRTVPMPLTQKIFDTQWVEAPVDVSASTPPDGSWLVLTDGADSEAVAKEFTAMFGTPTRRVVSADLSDESAVLEAFSQAAGDAELPPVGVVILAGPQPFDGSQSSDAPVRGRNLIWGVASSVRAVIGGWHGKAPRLWVVSRNGLAVAPDEPGDPSICALKGLIRVLAYEHPDLRTTLVDLPDDTLTPLVTELGLASSDDVIAWRDEHRYVERLSRATISTGKRDPVVRPDGAYILTGGLGGIGLAVTRWLVENGAARVVLNGRSEPSEDARTVLAELQERAQIVVAPGDIAAPGVAERLVSVAEETGLRLRGVVHSAVVLDDQIVAALSKESLERVWAPKAQGALRLHVATATADRELDWWVGFSSTSSLLGSPGQGAYAAASAWLDGLVDWRRASGLPATTINWGQWSDIGVARSLTFSALDPIAPAEGIEALESILAGDVGRVGVARLRLDRAAAAFPEIQRLGYFAALAEELDIDSDDDNWAGPDALREMDPAEANRLVCARLSGRILAVMGYPKNSTIDTDQPLTELGMDSLMAVRIRNTVRGDFGVEPPVALLLQGASLSDLTTDLIRQLGLEGQEKSESAGGVGDRAKLRAAARQRAAARRKVGDRA